MAFSRPFRALLKLSALWATPWAILGLGVGLIRWVATPELATFSSLAGWLGGHALAYGALGWISGIYLGLLFVRAEQSRRVDALAPRRVALLAALGGAAPPMLFAALGMMFGAPSVALVSLLGLGAVSAAGSAILATSVRAAGTRAALTGAGDRAGLPP